MSDVSPMVKICVLGAKGAGKTSLLERLAAGDFPKVPSGTTKPFSKLAAITNTLQDDADPATSLQVKFVECPSSFSDETRLASVMAEAFCTLLVYDVTDGASFDEAMRRWYPVANGLSPESFKMVVGCKVDAISERVVEPAPDTMPDLFFVEVSAKDRTNVDLVKSILFLRASHMLEKRANILEVHDYESEKSLHAAFDSMYGNELKTCETDPAELKEGLRHAAGGGASGTTIQDLLDSMPFALGRPVGGRGDAVSDTAAPKWDRSTPLAEAIDALVDRLETAKSQGGHLSSAGAVPPPHPSLSSPPPPQTGQGTTGEPSQVDKLARKYSELKKAFALCGITIDPPFPAVEELADLDLETLSRAPLRAPSNAPATRKGPSRPSQPPGAPVAPSASASSSASASASDSASAAPGPGPGPTADRARASQPKPMPLQTSKLAPSKPRRQGSPYSSRAHDWRPQSSKEVLTVKIELAGGREGTIHVRQGDSPFQLASDFVMREGLPGGEKTIQRLSKLLTTKVEALRFSMDSAPSPSTAHSPQTPPTTAARAPPGGRQDTAAPASEQKGSSAGRVVRKSVPRQQVKTSAGFNHPIATLNVEIGRTGRTGRIVVRAGDDPRELVTTFCKMYPGAITAKQAHELMAGISRRLAAA